MLWLDTSEICESLAPKYGLEVVGVDRHPLVTESTLLLYKAMSKNPDAVYMINFGLDAISAVRQLNNFGFTQKTSYYVMVFGF